MMTTEELLALAPSLTSLPSLRRARELLVGNPQLKASLSSPSSPLAPLLSRLVSHLVSEAGQEASGGLAELTELVLLLHSLVATHPGALLPHSPPRLLAAVVQLLQTRNYDLTLACLRLLHSLLTHCLPGAEPGTAAAAREVLARAEGGGAEPLTDPRLLRLLLLSGAKSWLVRDLILGLLAGLASSGLVRALAAVAAAPQLEVLCGLPSLVAAGASERALFAALVVHYRLLLLPEAPDRLAACPDALEAVGRLHDAGHSLRVRCLALGVLLRLGAARPAALDTPRGGPMPRLLHGFVRIAEAAADAPSDAGEPARMVFRDLAAAVLAAGPRTVAVVVSCARLPLLVDAVAAAAAAGPEQGRDQWREATHGLLAALAWRLEAARLTVAGLGSAQRLLRELAPDGDRERLVSDLLFVLALSRSVEVLRSLLADHPGLADFLLAVLRRARSACDSALLGLCLRAAANLALPVAGALHARLLERRLARELASVARDGPLGLPARLLALAALTNLALAPDPADVAGAPSLRPGGGAAPGQPSLRGPLAPADLVALLGEAGELPCAQERARLAACTAQLARNLLAGGGGGAGSAGSSGDEEEEPSGEPGALEPLAEALLGVAGGAGPAEAREAALMALASLAAAWRPSEGCPGLPGGDWGAQVVGLAKEARAPGVQVAALLALARLDERDLPSRRQARQEMGKAEAAMRSEAARFLRDRFLADSTRDEEMAAMSGSESS